MAFFTVSGGTFYCLCGTLYCPVCYFLLSVFARSSVTVITGVSQALSLQIIADRGRGQADENKVRRECHASGPLKEACSGRVHVANRQCQRGGDFQPLIASSASSCCDVRKLGLKLYQYDRGRVCVWGGGGGGRFISSDLDSQDFNERGAEKR